jgi:hypothetical protein
MHFISINRESPEAASLPPSFSKIPLLDGSKHDHVNVKINCTKTKDQIKEVKEIMYMLKPELRPKAKNKMEVPDDVKMNLSGLLQGRKAVKVSRTSPAGSHAGGKGYDPELDDECICNFAQEMLNKSKSASLVDAFKVLDANNSGVLSLSEFELGLRDMDIVMEKDESRRIFKWLDMDRQGSIALNEWNRLDILIKMLHRSGRYKITEVVEHVQESEVEEDEYEDEEGEEEEESTEPVDMKKIAGQRRGAIVQVIDVNFTKQLVNWKSDKQQKQW